MGSEWFFAKSVGRTGARDDVSKNRGLWKKRGQLVIQVIPPDAGEKCGAHGYFLIQAELQGASLRSAEADARRLSGRWQYSNATRVKVQVGLRAGWGKEGWMVDSCFFSSISAYGEKIYRNKRLLVVKTDYFWLFYGFFAYFYLPRIQAP